MKKIIALISAFVLVLGVGVFSLANATSTEECVPRAAYTETIEHPAVTHVVHTDAVPATDEVWANWAPNDTHGPQNYTPVWPEDSRGTWIVHNQLPPGQEGPDGVYQQGQGNSPWFYRHAGTNGTPAHDDIVTDRDAWTETIEHPAVVCTGGPTPVVPTPVVNDPPKTDKPLIVKHKGKKKIVIPTVVHAGL